MPRESRPGGGGPETGRFTAESGRHAAYSVMHTGECGSDLTETADPFHKRSAGQAPRIVRQRSWGREMEFYSLFAGEIGFFLKMAAVALVAVVAGVLIRRGGPARGNAE